jgi:hypothetical protein
MRPMLGFAFRSLRAALRSRARRADDSVYAFSTRASFSPVGILSIEVPR